MKDFVIDPDDSNLTSEDFVRRYKQHQHDYELKKHERDSIKEIERCIIEDDYEDEDMVREHIEFLEDILSRVSRILEMEGKEGYVNVSLNHDLKKIKKLCDRLTLILDRF